jgi:hypothetical protein
MIAGAVALVATGVGAAIGASTIVTGGVTLKAISTYATLAATAANIGAQATAKTPKQIARGSLNQRTIGANQSLPYLMGEAYSAGIQVHDVGYGPTLKKVPNPYRFLVVVHSCCGPVDGWVDTQADFASVGFSGTAATGYFNGFLYRSYQLGQRPEATALSPQWAGAPRWGSAYKLSGMAAEGFSFLFDKDGKVFASGIPALGSVLRGVRAYDPRRDDTYPGGSGPQRITDEETWEYTRNPALHALTYAYGRWVNGKKVFGVDLKGDGILLPPFVAWANLCDLNGWTVNGQIFEPGDKWNNLKLICQAGSAEPMYVGGLLSVRYDAPRVSLDTITMADLAGDELSAPAMKPWAQRINTVIPRFRSPAHQWAMTAGTAVTDSTSVAEDGEIKPDELQLALVTDPTQAAQLAGYRLANTRERGPIVLRCRPRLIEYSAGDCLTLADDVAAQLAVPAGKCVVQSREIDPATGIVAFTLESESDAKHDFALGRTTSLPPMVPPPAAGTSDQVAAAIVLDPALDAAAAAAAAQATADSKSTNSWGASPPAADDSVEGDLWAGPDRIIFRRLAGNGRLAIGGNRLTFGGNALVLRPWAPAPDARIGEALLQAQAANAAAAGALTAASAAQATADGKIDSFYQATAPTGATEGDFWTDTDDGNKLYRFTGGSWVSVQDGGIAAAIAAAATAQGTADGKVTTFYQAAAPGSGNEGDLWVDTDDGNKLYRYTAGAWTTVRDAGIAAAIGAAAAAQATADGKIDSFYQPTAPTGAGEGDLWTDTDDGNKLYRLTGGVWVSVQDGGIATAIAAAAGAQATADGKVTTYYQSAAPTGADEGDLWTDTDDANKLYRFTSGSWVSVRDGGIAAAIAAAADAQATADGKIDSFYQPTAPTGASEGDLWIDTDDGNKLYRLTSGVWVAARDSGIAQAISDAAGAQATADGKVTTFYQTAAPTDASEGDLWIDTDNDNLLSRYTLGIWVQVRDNAINRAQTTADGKIRSITRDTPPLASETAENDEWIDSANGNVKYRRLAGSGVLSVGGNRITFGGNGLALRPWERRRDFGIDNAQLTAYGAQSAADAAAIAAVIADGKAVVALSTADGKNTNFYATSAPTATKVNDTWYNPTTGEQRVWNGSSWTLATDQTALKQVVIEINPRAVSVATDYLGALPSGYSSTITPKVTRGGADIRTSSAVSYALTTSNLTATVDNTGGSATKGSVTVTGVAVETGAYYDLEATVDGIAQPAVRVTYSKKLGSPPSGGGSGAKLQSTSTFSALTATTATAIIADMSVTLASGERLVGSAPLDYTIDGNAGIRTASAKWQYFAGGVWNDFGAAIIGSNAIGSVTSGSGDVSDPTPGHGDFNQAVSGLSAGSYACRLMAYQNTGGRTMIFTGTATIEAKV